MVVLKKNTCKGAKGGTAVDGHGEADRGLAEVETVLDVLGDDGRGAPEGRVGGLDDKGLLDLLERGERDAKHEARPCAAREVEHGLEGLAETTARLGQDQVRDESLGGADFVQTLGGLLARLEQRGDVEEGRVGLVRGQKAVDLW